MQLQPTTVSGLAACLACADLLGHPVLCCGQVRLQLDSGLTRVARDAAQPAVIALSGVALKRFLCLVEPGGIRLVPCLAQRPGQPLLGGHPAGEQPDALRPPCHVFVPGPHILLHAKTAAPEDSSSITPALYLQVDLDPTTQPNRTETAAASLQVLEGATAAAAAAWREAGIPSAVSSALLLTPGEMTAIRTAEEVHVVPCAADDGGAATVDSLFDACNVLATEASVNSAPALVLQGEGNLLDGDSREAVDIGQSDSDATFYTAEGHVSVRDLMGNSCPPQYADRSIGFGEAGEASNQIRPKRGRNE